MTGSDQTSDRPDWSAAACKDVGELFFNDQFHDEAVMLCTTCPIRERCFRYAVKYKIDDGIWGGMGPVKRRAYRRYLQQDPFPTRPIHVSRNLP